MGVIVYARRNSTPAAYDTALVDLLTGAGHVVDQYTGTLAGVDWSGVDLLIVGALGTNYTEHTDGSTLNDYDVDIISLCRYTSRISLAMSTNSALDTVSSFTRLVSDPRAIFASVSTDPAASHRINLLTSGTTLIYRNNVDVAYSGISERMRDGYSRVHFGYHRFDIASANMASLFLAFLPAFEVSIEAAEGNDSGAWSLQHIPPDGFRAWIDAAEQDDAALLELDYTPLYRSTIAMQEDSDTGVLQLDNQWDRVVNDRSAKIIYRCFIEANGYERLEVKISSWQATQQLDRSSYAQAVIPAARDIYQAIAARRGGEFVIYRGARLEQSDIENLMEIVRSPMGQVRLDSGPQRTTVTVSGYSSAFMSTNRVIYAQRNSTAQNYDTALIQSLQARGWDVRVMTGDLSLVDWTRVNLLVIGAPGTQLLLHQNASLLATLPVPVVSLCRATSQTDGLGLATAGILATVSSMARTTEDVRATYATLTAPAASSHELQSLHAETTLIYSGSQSGRAGIAERIENGYSRMHWGYHNLQQAGTEMMQVFENFTGGIYVPDTDQVRTLQKIRSVNASPGLRARCEIDWRLRPGMTAIMNGVAITAAYINYYVNASDSYMDVGERVS
jgi:hypothetical protein